MNKKKLDFKYPTITCHPSTAGLMSILENYNFTKPWIYGNYIQIVGGIRDGSVYGGNSFDVAILPSYHAEKNCPWILHSQLTRKTIKEFSSSIIDFIIKSIDSNNYVYLVVDEFFLSNSIPGKEKTHMPHDIFIYGYDLDSQLFYVADFTFSNSSKYQYNVAKFDEFQKAYNNINDENDFFYYEKGGIALLNFYSSAKYFFDIQFVKFQFFQLYHSEDYSEKFRFAENPFDKRAYGLEIYDLLIFFLNQPSSITSYHGLTKSLSNLLDHKRLMLKRIQYMDEKGVISNYSEIHQLYKNIEESFSRLVSLSIKFYITHDNNIKSKIISILYNTKQSETEVIELILENIN